MAGSAAPIDPQWRKSSYSAEANCVEVAELDDGAIAVRNSDAQGSVVSVSREDFRAFVLGVKAGEFDDLT